MQVPPLLSYPFCYAMIFLLTWINKEEGKHRFITDQGGITSNPVNTIGFHIIGILWMGLVPALVLHQPVLKTLTGNRFPDSSLLIFFLLLLMLTAAMAMKAGTTIRQRFDKTTDPNYQLPVLFVICYFLIRMVFLFVYELWFRGFLLFDSIHAMGIPLAVSVNVLLYFLLHLFSSKKEMLACIPFGLLVCWLSILFKAVWPAVALHITFSLLYEINVYQSHYATSKTARV